MSGDHSITSAKLWKSTFAPAEIRSNLEDQWPISVNCSCCYCGARWLLVHYLFTKKLLNPLKNHLDVLFRTVSRGSRVPQGQFSEGSEKVGEGWRKLGERGRLREGG